MTPPSGLQPTTDYLLFHSAIRRPVWEDPLNLTGGKWIIRLRKGVADRLWEDLVLAIIGDLFDECRSSAQATGNGDGADPANGSENGSVEEFPEICGCTISVRQSEDIISLWNRVEGDKQCREKIRCVVVVQFGAPDQHFLTLWDGAGIHFAKSSTFHLRLSWSTKLIMVFTSPILPLSAR